VRAWFSVRGVVRGSEEGEQRLVARTLIHSTVGTVAQTVASMDG
jgi:hypothetical protein